MPDRTKENEEIKALRKILSDNIRSYRKELHLTQEALAEAADISLSYLADIEHCKTWISDKTLLKPKKTNIKKISDIIYDEKKTLLKSVSEICDKSIQKIMKVK